MDYPIIKFIHSCLFMARFKLRGKRHSKILYLTFDDGPTPQVTEWVLDTLDRFNAKATFFCIAKNVELYPDIYQEILRRGHAVGNHTYSHVNSWNTPNREYINDVELASEFIESNLFRPPYGKLRLGQLIALNRKFHVIFWGVLSMDYKRNVSPRQCYRNVMYNSGSGSIVVYHDSHKAFRNVRFSLPRVLSEFQKRGFKFEKLVLK